MRPVLLAVVLAQGTGCTPARRLARRWTPRARVVDGYLCRHRALTGRRYAVRCSSKTALVRFTWTR